MTEDEAYEELKNEALENHYPKIFMLLAEISTEVHKIYGSYQDAIMDFHFNLVKRILVNYMNNISFPYEWLDDITKQCKKEFTLHKNEKLQ